MIRISDFRVPIEKAGQNMEKLIRAELGISDLHPLSWKVFRKSIDARKGHGFSFIYTIDAVPAKEEKIFNRGRRTHKNWQLLKEEPPYKVSSPSHKPKKPPVVVGAGPAGLFAALLLARAGLKPIVIERGRPVEKRSEDVRLFFTRQILDPSSNVQFGEGGAGTFSDGKVNTLVRDPSGRGRFVLETMVEKGAPETILYDQKPHIGTDRLKKVVRALREEMISLGATVLFETTLTALLFDPDAPRKVRGISCRGPEGVFTLECDTVFLGIGHSARDTFRMLADSQIPMEAKPFAVGLRIEHPREMINRDQYREYASSPYLEAASYKLSGKAADGKGVYTFCMCPGGLVVSATSEKGRLVTNGMSNYARDEANSNAALLVGVTPQDCALYAEEMNRRNPNLASDLLDHPGYDSMSDPANITGFDPAGSSAPDASKNLLFSGVYFQEQLERTAFLMGGSNYSAPIQLVGDYLSGTDRISSLGDIAPSFTGPTVQTNLHDLLPSAIGNALSDGIRFFGTKLKGFDRDDAVLTGIESRSSSPLRILREADMQSAVKGLYPIGEGAGYAGGIMSAAMDGMKAAETYLSALEDKG